MPWNVAAELYRIDLCTQNVDFSLLLISGECKSLKYPASFATIPDGDSGGIHRLLLLLYMATSGGFPGNPVRNGRKERKGSMLKRRAFLAV